MVFSLIRSWILPLRRAVGRIAACACMSAAQVAHPDWKIFDVRARPSRRFRRRLYSPDLSRFESGSGGEIYASHVLEHLGYVESCLAPCVNSTGCSLPADA